MLVSVNANSDLAYDSKKSPFVEPDTRGLICSYSVIQSGPEILRYALLRYALLRNAL